MTTAWGLYGQSLYDLAVEEKADEQIMEELEAVRGILAQNPDYVTLLSEPSVPVKTRTQLLTGSGAGAFDGIAVVVCPFIGEIVHVISSYGDIQVN